MADSGDEMPKTFAHQLERLSVIRSRFRRNMHWLQWPVRVCQSKVDEDEGEVETHTVGTKSLELNADAVREMVEWYHGDFVDITQLTLEAPFS